MPNFLTWGMNQDNSKFGAYVQLNANVFKPQPDGTVQVAKAPRTEFFDGGKINHMLEVAGEKSKPFWEQMASVFPAQEALFQNSRDIDTKAKPVTQGPAPELALTSKPAFSS